MRSRLPVGVLSDLLLALGFMLADFVEELIRLGGGSAGVGYAAANSLPLVSVALRRWRPLLGLLVLTVVAAASSLVSALLPDLPVGSGDVTVPIIALLVMTYSLGAHGTGREVVLGIFQPLLLIVVLDLLTPGRHSVSGALPFFAVFVVGAPVLAGRLVRTRRAVVIQLRRQEREIKAERAARTDAAVALERLNLTEHLHEKLIAGMESVASQALDALRPLEEGGTQAVAAIEVRARDLLAETRRVVVSLASANPDRHVIDDQPLVARKPRHTQVDAAAYAALPWAAIAAAAVCVGLLVEIGAANHARVPLPIALASCFVLAAPIAFAWRHPLLMTAALWALAALFVLIVAPLSPTFTAISLSFLPPFAVAYLESRGRSLMGLAICGLGEVASFGLEGWAGTSAILFFAWIAGRVFRDRVRLVEELRSSNIALAEERDARLRSAVLEERARLARELHDAIGHSLTVIALHGGAARRMWRSDRERAEAALRTIYQVAAEGLTELKMGFSPSNVDKPSTDIEELVRRAQATGLHVKLCMAKPMPALSAEIELEAYRVLQEALTNVLKHAPGASTEVTVRNAGPDVELVVANSAGTPAPAQANGGGRGLEGMRRRAEACGGRLDWRLSADGGFEVRAQFPAMAMPT
ncbi:MAG TPA: histidine kinase [Candidatus Dormibacteraeota bacterium]|nr:histidine kinase [Candidatus Dormibacteraeota bacterium]